MDIGYQKAVMVNGIIMGRDSNLNCGPQTTGPCKIKLRINGRIMLKFCG